MIIIELFPHKAPLTFENFLRYVDEGRYNDFHFYRVVDLKNQKNNNVKIEVIQGGLGFAAFRSIISGMQIIKFIHQLPSNNQMLNRPIKIKSIKRI